MSKPDDIPQDVWAASAAAYEFVCDAEPISSDAATVIARFIMAERERCAAAAEQRGKELGEPAIGSDIGNTIRGRF